MDIDSTQVHECFEACGRIDLKGKTMNHTNNNEELLLSALFLKKTPPINQSSTSTVSTAQH